MNDFPRWKSALVVVVLLLGILYGVPNLFVQQPAVQVTANRGATIDEALKERVQGVLEKDKITFQGIEFDKDHMLVRLPIGASDDQNKALEAMKAELGEQYVVAPNLASTVPSWMLAIGAREMPKGLDLQGGVHFLMEVDDKDVMDKQVQRYADDIRGVLREKNIRYQSVNRGAKGVVVQLRSAEERDAARAAIQVKVPDVVVSDGPGTADAFVLNASVKPDKVREVALNTIRQNQATLSNRINALGVAEPLIQQQGETRIVVELPGVQDTAAAKRVLGAQATLEYHAVDQDADAFNAMRTGNVPPDDKLYYMRNLGADGRKVPVLLKKKIIVSGDEMVNATSELDQQSGTPSVSVQLNATGGRKMLDFTTQSVGKPMAVLYVERTPEVKVVDGKEVRSTKITEEVISVATIRGVFSTRFQTTGLDSMKEASDLALLLRSGSLAAPIDIVEERVIGPSLGADNIKKGVYAVAIGLAAVLVFMAFYYWLFGLIADIALFFNLVLLLAVMSAIGVTLTMPGIAGIVLTLGMAVDANVLIAERIREEIRAGNSPLTALRAGYEKAWGTILDANLTHVFASLAMFAFGSGPIRGFAITMFAGILTSMFSAVTVTQLIMALIYGRQRKVQAISV